MKIKISDYKRGGLLFLLIFILFFSFSCKYQNTPEAVTRRFLISFNQLDMNAAKNLSTKETWPFLTIMELSTANVSQEKKEEIAKEFKVKILKVEKESDSTAIVTFQTTPQRLPFDQFRLFKVKDKNGDFQWKVDISTLDLLDSKDTRDSLNLGEPEMSPTSGMASGSIQNPDSVKGD